MQPVSNILGKFIMSKTAYKEGKHENLKRLKAN